MKNIAFGLLLVLSSFSGPSAFAALVCKWTAQGTDTNFKTDDIFSKKPVLEKEGCSGANAPPTCSGYVYCAESEALPTAPPPKAGLAACNAIKVEGKWRCPNAQTCIDDPDIAVSNLARIPSKVQVVTPVQGSSEGAGTRK